MTLDLAAIFKNAPVPAMVLDAELKFHSANQAYLDMTSKREDELIGNYVFDVFPEEAERVEAMLEVFRSTLRGEKPVFREIPFTIEFDGEPTERWFTAHHAPIAGPSGKIEFLVQYSEDVTDQVRLREMKDTILGEMRHRIGNLFTVVSALSRHTARQSKDLPDFLENYQKQLNDYFSAQKELLPDSKQRDDIRSVIEHQLSVYADKSSVDLRIEGSDIAMSPEKARALSMVIHELSTNAVKYGAIAAPDGHLAIQWTQPSPSTIELTWRESGLTKKPKADSKGYGTHILFNVLPKQLGGEAERIIGDDSYTYRLVIDNG